MKKENLYAILVAVFTASILIGNTVVNKFFHVFGDFYLTPAVFLFPIPMIIGDIVSESYSKKHLRNMIFIGFAMNLFMSMMYLITIKIPTDGFTDEAYQYVLGSSFRILVASLSGYLVSGFTNASIMWFMKSRSKNGKGFSIRAFVSTLFGQAVDNFTFGFIAFLGILPLSTIALMTAFEVVVEILIETILLPFTHMLQKKVKMLE